MIEDGVGVIYGADGNKISDTSSLAKWRSNNVSTIVIDGDGHLIRGLFFEDASSTGTFGLVGGKAWSVDINNVGIEDMYAHVPNGYVPAFIGNINVMEVEEVDFNASSNTDTMLKIDAIEQDEEETTTSEETKGNNFNWQYIPTIATFAAIVIAVVGVFARRNMKFKKRVGGKKVDYDRDITVMQNKYRRIASDTRDKEVRELTKECNELVALRTEYEDKYKEIP